MGFIDVNDTNNPWNKFRTSSPDSKYFHLQNKQVGLQSRRPAVWTTSNTIPSITRHSIVRPDLEAATNKYEEQRKAQDERDELTYAQVQYCRANKQKTFLRTQKSLRAQLEYNSGQPVHTDEYEDEYGRPDTAPVPVGTSPRARNNLNPKIPRRKKEKWETEHYRVNPPDHGQWRYQKNNTVGSEMIEKRTQEEWEREMAKLEKRDELKDGVYRDFQQLRKHNTEKLRSISTPYVPNDGPVGKLTMPDSSERLQMLAESKQRYEIYPDLPPDHNDLMKLNRDKERDWSFSRPTTKKGNRVLMTKSASAGHLRSLSPKSATLPNSNSMANLGKFPVPGHDKIVYRKTQPRPRRVNVWGCGYDDWEKEEAENMRDELDSFEKRLVKTPEKNRNGKKRSEKPIYLMTADKRPPGERRPRTQQQRAQRAQ